MHNVGEVGGMGRVVALGLRCSRIESGVADNDVCCFLL